MDGQLISTALMFHLNIPVPCDDNNFFMIHEERRRRSQLKKNERQISGEENRGMFMMSYSGVYTCVVFRFESLGKTAGAVLQDNAWVYVRACVCHQY